MEVNSGEGIRGIMTNFVLTRQQIEDLFHFLTLQMTGLCDDQVRLTFAPNGQPAWDKDKDYAFITVSYLDNPYDKQRDITQGEYDEFYAQQSVTYTRVLQVLWTFYGPNSFDLADEIKNGILQEQYRSKLTRNKIFPLTDIPAPVRAPESFNNQWWERVDVRVFFNAFTARRELVPYIQSADISIYDDNGLQRVVEVREEP